MTALEKVCSLCKEVKPRDGFSPEPRMTSGLKSYCRDCNSRLARERWARDPETARAKSRASSKKYRNPEQTRVWHLKAKYGLTRDAYQAILDSQDGRCAICKTGSAGGRGNWHVDHDHGSGRIRGLLCSTCNVGVGMFKDSPALLVAAADYLTEEST